MIIISTQPCLYIAYSFNYYNYYYTYYHYYYHLWRQVRAGTKEQAVLEMMAKFEKDTDLSNLSNSDTPTDFDATVRARVYQVLTDISTQRGATTDTTKKASNGRNSDPSFVISEATAGNMKELSELDPDDPQREALLQAEIEQFRLKQAARDRYVLSLLHMRVMIYVWLCTGPSCEHAQYTVHMWIIYVYVNYVVCVYTCREAEESRKEKLRERIQQLKIKQVQCCAYCHSVYYTVLLHFVYAEYTCMSPIICVRLLCNYMCCL